MFIVSLTYKTSIDEVEKHLNAHVEYLKQQYAAKNFIASGRKIPRTGGVIMSALKDEDALMKVLKDDPFYKFGVADYDVIQCTLSMTAEGYEILSQ